MLQDSIRTHLFVRFMPRAPSQWLEAIDIPLLVLTLPGGVSGVYVSKYRVGIKSLTMHAAHKWSKKTIFCEM